MYNMEEQLLTFYVTLSLMLLYSKATFFWHNYLMIDEELLKKI